MLTRRDLRESADEEAELYEQLCTQRDALFQELQQESDSGRKTFYFDEHQKLEKQIKSCAQRRSDLLREVQEMERQSPLTTVNHSIVGGFA